MLEIRGIWLCHMSRWDRYVLRPWIWVETPRFGTVPHIGPYIDSPSVMSKFASPSPHDASTESATMSDTSGDVSTTLDDIGSLSHALEKQIAAAKNQELKFLILAILLMKLTII